MWDATSMPVRVLVVDDNRDTAASLAFLFGSWGHEVRTAHDGPTALATAQEFLPDAILLDIGLPQLDGFEVAQQLRARPEFARTLLVAASGYTRNEDRRRAAEVGIDLYLVKPFNAWELETMLASCRAAQAVSA